MKTRSHFLSAVFGLAAAAIVGVTAWTTPSSVDAWRPTALHRAIAALKPEPVMGPVDTIPFRGVANDTLGRLAGVPGWGNQRWPCQDSVRAGGGSVFLWPVTALAEDTLGGAINTFTAALDSADANNSHANCHDVLLMVDGVYSPDFKQNRMDSLVNVRISGQVAQGEGVLFDNYSRAETRAGSGLIGNRVYEYFRIRGPGINGGMENLIKCRACSRIIQQNISVAWASVTNNLMIIESGTETVTLPDGEAQYHTVYRNLFFEPDGGHATLLGIGGNYLAGHTRRPTHISVIGNYFQGPGRRFPRLGAQVDTAQVLHNVAYNWQNWPIEVNANIDTGPTYRTDIIGYYFKRGPDSEDAMPIRVGQNDSTVFKMHVADLQSMKGNNYEEGLSQDSLIRGSKRMVGCVAGSFTGPGATPGWCSVTDDSVYLHAFVNDTMPTGPSWATFDITPFDSATRAAVRDQAGNSRNLGCGGQWSAWGSVRDSIDTRAMTEFNDSTGEAALLDASTRTYGTPASGTACTDTDSDGLPNAYETAQCGTTTCIPSWGEWVNGRWAGDWYLQGCNLDGTLVGDASTSCGGTALAAAPPDTIPAFSGTGGQASGWGATAFHSSRAMPLVVRLVTNTNSTGAGSLKGALGDVTDSTFDIIMFRTGGRSENVGEISSGLSHVYVAGQTAPGGGFIWTTDPLIGQNQTDAGTDIVIRFLSAQKIQSKGLRVCGERVIYDHLTITRTGSDTGASNTDALQTCQRFGTPESRYGTYTVSNTMAGDVHDDGNSTVNANARLQSFVRNYIFGVGRRIININSDTAQATGFEVANNIFYNWGGNGAYAGTFGTQFEGSYIYNYIKPGPATPSSPLYAANPAHWDDSCDATRYPSGCTMKIHWEGNRNALNGYATVSMDSSWAIPEIVCRDQQVGQFTPDCAANDDPIPAAYRRDTLIWTVKGIEPYWPYTIRQPFTDAYLDSIMSIVGNSKSLQCDGTFQLRRSAYDSTKVAEFTGDTGPSTAVTWANGTHLDPDSTPTVAIPAAGTPCAMVGSGNGLGLYHEWLALYGFDTTVAGAPPADSVTNSGYLLIETMLNGSHPSDPTPWTGTFGAGGGSFGAVARYVYFVPMQTLFGISFPTFTPINEIAYGILNPAADTMMVVSCTDQGTPVDSATVHARMSAWARPGISTAVTVRDFTPFAGMAC